MIWFTVGVTVDVFVVFTNSKKIHATTVRNVKREIRNKSRSDLIIELE